MNQSLVISALSSDRPGIVNDLSKLTSDARCNITDSRMTVLGGEFAIIMMVTGSDEQLSQLESMLEERKDQLRLTITCKRTSAKVMQNEMQPYRVNVVAIDHEGIVYEIANFFAQKNINIDNMNTETYAAPHTGTPMFALNVTVEIPSGLSVSKLKNEFLDFCEDRNLDAIIEPCR